MEFSRNKPSKVSSLNDLYRTGHVENRFHVYDFGYFRNHGFQLWQIISVLRHSGERKLPPGWSLLLNKLFNNIFKLELGRASEVIYFVFVFVFMGWSLLSNALRLFKIYCAPPNLGIRT